MATNLKDLVETIDQEQEEWSNEEEDVMFEQCPMVDHVSNGVLHALKEWYKPGMVSITKIPSSANSRTLLVGEKRSTEGDTMVHVGDGGSILPLDKVDHELTGDTSSEDTSSTVISDSGISVPVEGTLGDERSAPGARVMFKVEVLNRTVTELHEHIRNAMYGIPQLQVGIGIKVWGGKDENAMNAIAMIYYRNVAKGYVREMDPNLKKCPTCVLCYRFGTEPEDKDVVAELKGIHPNVDTRVILHTLDFEAAIATPIPCSDIAYDATIRIPGDKILSNVNLETKWVIKAISKYCPLLELEKQKPDYATRILPNAARHLPPLNVCLTSQLNAYLCGLQTEKMEKQNEKEALQNAENGEKAKTQCPAIQDEPNANSNAKSQHTPDAREKIAQAALTDGHHSDCDADTQRIAASDLPTPPN